MPVLVSCPETTLTMRPSMKKKATLKVYSVTHKRKDLSGVETTYKNKTEVSPPAL